MAKLDLFEGFWPGLGLFEGKAGAVDCRSTMPAIRFWGLVQDPVTAQSAQHRTTQPLQRPEKEMIAVVPVGHDHIQALAGWVRAGLTQLFHLRRSHLNRR